MVAQSNGIQAGTAQSNGLHTNGNGTNGTSAPPPLVFIFDNPRTRSHLFHRWISTHPAFQPHWHPFVAAAFLGPERHTLHTHNSPARNKDNLNPSAPSDETYASCADNLDRAVAATRETGKILLANEHTIDILPQDVLFALTRGEKVPPSSNPKNPTTLSDASFAALKPIILIRNPFASLPSNYTAACKSSQMRPPDEDFTLFTSLRFARHLHDRLVALGREPIVVDGDDVLWRTQEVKEAVCGALGLDPEGVTEEWKPIAEDGDEAAEDGAAKRYNGIDKNLLKGYLGEVMSSTGIKRPKGGKPAEPTLKSETAKWREMWGEEVAQQLARRAEDIMPDYEYLRQFKV